ncbi:MAG TPA: hypothetical protein VM818_23385 [Vicinamibacterales bacterium]|nr:hypothetical protein [Vicinamibacterales bacterium]
MVIRRIGPVSCARIAGILYALFGLVMGAVFSVMALAGGFGNTSDQTGFAALIGAGAVVVFPILYGGMGFVGTFVGAWLYNALAASVGGIELDVQ